MADTAKKVKKVNLEREIIKPDGKVLTNKAQKEDKQGNLLFEDIKGSDGKVTKSPILWDKPMKIRDYIILFLSQRFTQQTNREMFWATQIGIQCADEKIKEVELSENQLNFLIRLMKENKLKIQNPMGQDTDREILFPYEKAQTLEELMTPEQIEEWLEEEELEEKLKAKKAAKTEEAK